MIEMTATERIAIAAILGIHEQYLYQCITGRRKMPPDRCPDFERAVRGRITCDQLRPDVAWIRVPDLTWPHPDGRPCIDVAAPSEAA